MEKAARSRPMGRMTSKGRNALDAGTAEESAGRRPEKRKKKAAVLQGERFDTEAFELSRSWHGHASHVCCVNSYPSGLVITLHDQCRGLPARHFDLRTRETREYLSAHGRSFTVLEGCRDALERQLSKLHQDGALSSTVLYFGTTADPFFAFHKRFAITTQCLQAFERYQPGLLVLQTRSPMAIAALPTLHLLRERSVVVVPIESHLERSIARYTPGQPKIGERLVLAQGLRRQGIKVAISVSPVLPYGEYHRDAWEFADLLNRYADYISLGCLASGRPSDEKELKALAMARTLAADEQFHWLRPGAHEALFHAVNAIAPQKLLRPAVPGARVSQMSLFAAA